MKIAIDGFHLGFTQGTGLTTYARNLANLLTANGHEVYPIYGLNRIGSDPQLAFSNLIQSLALYGEDVSVKNLLGWTPYALVYFLKKKLKLPIIAKEIKTTSFVDYSDIAQRIPNYSRIFNLPSLYRSSQALSCFSGSSLSIKLPKKDRPDLFHLTSPLPIRMPSVPNIVTVHDLIPLTLPHTTKHPLKYYQTILNASLRHADLIFAVSQHTKQTLVDVLKIPPEKIHVTYQAVNIPPYYLSLSSSETASFVEKTFQLKFQQYFLFYGTIEPKKNVLKILEAAALAKTDFPIVIVGKNGWLYEDVEKFFQRNAHSTRFRRFHYLPFHQLMYLLKGARALVFPSLSEGFGLPVLEAMQMGCSVITSATGSLPEIGGSVVHYVNPLDAQELAHTMDLLSSGFRFSVEKILDQAKRFSLQNYLMNIEVGYRDVF